MKIAQAPIFVYGTLTSPQVVRTLLGRTVALQFPPARLSGYSRHSVKNFVYPGMIPSNNDDSPQRQEVHGCLLENLSHLEMKLLNWFEGDEYERRLVKVSTNDDILIDAHAYIWKSHLLEELNLQEEWCYETFCKEHLEWYLENTVRPCRREMEDLGMTKP